MAEFKATLDQVGKGFKLPAGKHTVTVQTTSRVRLYGMFFDLDKCFLLPSAMTGIRGVKGEYDAHPGANLLAVGHTDTSGQDAYNLDLSLERADAVAAFLTDQVAAWEAFFGTGKADEKRWGTREIQHMLSVLPEGGSAFFGGAVDGKDGPETQGAVKGFQEANGIKATGTADAATRKAVIKAYMGLDGTSLPAGTALTTHGCGENFPAVETEDGVRSPDDRRVEIFIFDGPIAPPPPGKTSQRGSKQYPVWIAGVGTTLDFDLNAPAGGDVAARTFHVSVLAVAENTLKPLANTAYTLKLNDGKTFSKVTDAQGRVEQAQVRPGDHTLEIAGGKTLVPAVPPELKDLVWVVLGAKEPEE
jgi:outer membrane protein OmpA-like peptidoglycan-associated protein